PICIKPALDYLEWTIIDEGRKKYLVLINTDSEKSAIVEINLITKYKTITDISVNRNIRVKNNKFVIRISPAELKIFKVLT
ncbi:hypothetical protein J7K56_05030, partial [Candidatus Calescamantes bacterium]|nr:hypothetical protein [Candidatus Calescamantes bacterium]